MEPKTKLKVSQTEAAQTRLRVQEAKTFEGVLGVSRLATREDAPAILELLMDERVSGAVYTLPRPFSLESVGAWIGDHTCQAQIGEGLLMCAKDENGRITAITDFQFWPEYSACEFGGVIAAHLQSKSYGTTGIRELCDWVCDVIGIRLLVMTSSLDNIRSNKIFTSMGFKDMGEIDSVRPDGTKRRSRYWELER